MKPGIFDAVYNKDIIDVKTGLKNLPISSAQAQPPTHIVAQWIVNFWQYDEVAV